MNEHMDPPILCTKMMMINIMMMVEIIVHRSNGRDQVIHQRIQRDGRRILINMDTDIRMIRMRELMERHTQCAKTNQREIGRNRMIQNLREIGRKMTKNMDQKTHQRMNQKNMEVIHQQMSQSTNQT